MHTFFDTFCLDFLLLQHFFSKQRNFPSKEKKIKAFFLFDCLKVNKTNLRSITYLKKSLITIGLNMTYEKASTAKHTSLLFR